MSIQAISNIIYDIKDNLTDFQFKSIMDTLLILNKQLPTNDKKKAITEEDWCNKFYKQYFYHSNQNNKLYKYQYIMQDQSLLIFYEYTTKRVCVGNHFIYERVYDDELIEDTDATIINITPKYCKLLINNHQKKISNLTLCKLIHYPYIVIL